MKLDRDVLVTGGGMLLLLAGRKMAALGMFARGVYGLEQRFRAAHPDLPASMSERWRHSAAFYDTTHKNQTHRALHRIGIPLVVGGAVGLIVAKPFRPLWALSASSFTLGWALNFVGHYYEGKEPAFASDPLSFIAGPVWDWQQRRAKARPVPVSASARAN